MNISKINNINFGAGKVIFNRLNSDNLNNYKEIKQLADKSDIDIFISKSPQNKYMPNHDIYSVVASKDYPIVTRDVSKVEKIKAHGSGCTIVSKNTSLNELSEKILSTTMKAVENLEKRIKIRK